MGMAILMLYKIWICDSRKVTVRSLHFFFVHFFFIFSGGILILLVFRDEIVHVGFGFSEFHFVHTFTGVPMEESLSSEHCGELFTNSLEHFLDGGGVTEEGNGHLETLWWDIANSRLDVVWNPFNEVRGVLVLTLSICSSTSLVDILPLNMAEAVRYLPCLGSEAHIMFLASNICWVSYGTVRALYCWDPLEVSGEKPVMKK